jgi:hypothetical protein
VHRWRIEPNPWLYAAKLGHGTYRRLEDCSFGVTKVFWDVVFLTSAPTIRRHIPSS